ncbi:MAG: nuclear transport factor 2 family protein, partial [Acidimicrobiaceae bacterium]|nr:nuclear transport factor 2 family protein [Acidimicrobiaceae bacterium]
AEPGTSLEAAEVEGCVPADGKATSFNPLYFSLKMPDNTKVNAELGAVDGQIDSSDVGTGDCIRGKVGFALPTGTRPSALYFEELLGGSPLRWTLPSTPTSTPTSAAQAVVQEYFDAINARNFQRAWDLGGKNLHGGDYATFVQGFSETLKDTITSASAEGNTVHVTLEATQVSGERQVYQGTYTVENGVIVSAEVSRVA